MRARPRLLAILVVVPFLVLPVPGGASPAGHAGPRAVGAAVAGSCPGTTLPARYSGSLSVLNSYGPAPSIANRTIGIHYYYQQNTTYPNGSRTVQCVPTVATVRTIWNGSFGLAPSRPNDSCNKFACFTYLGPFGPAGLAPSDAPPAGDVVRVSVSGSHAYFLWTSALRTVGVVHAAGPVVSADDPTTFVAIGTAGDGAPSPATLVCHWVLSGEGWRVLSGAFATNVSVVGIDGAGPAELDLFANSSYNGTAYPSSRVVEKFTDRSTRLSSAVASAAAIDEGNPLNLSLNGSGAAGYSYRATLLPGLGVAPVPLSCRVGAADASADVAISCAGTWSYPTAGTARPMVNLTNGYSSANVSLSAIDVAPGLSITVGPEPARGYVGWPVDFSLVVPPGSGTAPYGTACLSPGDGTTACAAAGTGNWSVAYRYASAGSYVATLSIADAVGENRSAVVPVTIADAPALAPLAVRSPGPVLGAPVQLSANLSGGLWPATYWWNDSLPNATLRSGALESDGLLSDGFTPDSPGAHVITLTVLDAAGSRVAVSDTVEVVPGPATGIVLAGSAGAPVGAAGATIPVTLAAVDLAGVGVPGYAGDLTVTVVGPPTAPPPTLVAGGLALSGGSGPYRVPSAAWSSGRLELGFSETRAGAWNLSIVPANASGPSGITVSVGVQPDEHHPGLRDPRYVAADPRDSRTLWRIADRYGNPILDGYVVVQSLFPGATLTQRYPVLDAGGVGQVWVNFSALNGGAGTVVVSDAYGDPLLPSIGVPAEAPAFNGTALLAGLAVAGIAAGGVGLIRYRDRRRTRQPPSDEWEAELERVAVGREHLVRRLSAGATDSLAYLAVGWEGPGPVPSPAEVAEWLGALVADGTATARPGPGGRPAFALAPSPGTTPTVTLDDDALGRALGRRTEDAGSYDAPD